MLTDNTLTSLASTAAIARPARREHAQPVLLRQRSPSRASVGSQGCWPFHACAICAPPA